MYRGINFAPFCRRGTLNSGEAKESLDLMIEKTGADFVIFAPNGLQETAHSEEICYTSEGTCSDEELVDMIRYAKSKGMTVGVKPTVNCRNGSWRAYVSFFEEDVVCEPKWGNWFASYTDFQTHYARIAQREECDLFIAGCEMVMSEHREKEWRQVIAAVREVYDGIVTYNTDKYQEHNVKWWDCLDMISSSGYYPSGKWEEELDRIESVVKKYDKPFLFAETGCMSRRGSAGVPNDWSLQGELDLREQADWYEEMFSACEKRSWIRGLGLWEWPAHIMSEKKAVRDSGYYFMNKPAQEVIRHHYEKEIW